MNNALQARKAEARAAARALRAKAAAAAPDAGHALAAAALATLPLQSAQPSNQPSPLRVSAYWPMGSEMDPRPLLAALHARDHPLCLPVVMGAGRPLVFRRWVPGDPLVPAGFGTSVPGEGAAEMAPDLLFVPLLAFDTAGYRLGYGGGFYDRTLAALRAVKPVLAVGLGYAAQQVAEVPHDSLDQRLDWIVTETRAFACG